VTGVFRHVLSLHALRDVARGEELFVECVRRRRALWFGSSCLFC